MKLYHYSQEEYTSLISIYGRGVSEDDKKRLGEWATKVEGPFAYTKSISFFMEPIPVDLPSILHNEHTFWVSGKTLCEHVVDVSALPADVPYRLVEASEKTDLIYRKQNWKIAEKNPELEALYKKQIKELEESLKLEGYGISGLKKLASRYMNIRKSYEELYKLHKKFPEDNLLSKYAALVPHLMVYTADHPVKVNRSYEVTLK